MKRDAMLHWYPVLLRYGGLGGALVFVPIVWVMTDRLEPALIAMFLTMMGLGEGIEALRDFTKTKPENPPMKSPQTTTEE